ncbi:helix-turn-helix domain-containing protein [Allopusillimonas ginsengisoli]|uniref:helix-turn-helix domain-containing protein n=1 Tax=Allopusillimonas ginsengisoli TaxID=453575 RepID=UPI0010214496|nr:helix-turn-helix domain-containing protein [Allopusillimonas ginsengisoli]TEA77330.1 helix-turn-helix domain-containing protein [Allopusillimonas ginsengisoli]
MNQPLLREEAKPQAPLPEAAEDPSLARQSAQAAGHPESAGIGAALRSMREARGISRGEVSSRLKFSSRQIEALETEQWDRLPRGVSLRGFVKNYARFLEADVPALLSMLDHQVGDTNPREASVTSAASLSTSDVPLHGEPVSRPWGWLVIILILLFVAGFYAVERGWIPDSWLVFDWLKSLKND